MSSPFFNEDTDKVHTRTVVNKKRNQRFYKSKEWVKLRNRVRDEADNICEWHWDGNIDLGLPGGEIVSTHPINGKKQGDVHHHYDINTEYGWQQRLNREHLHSICLWCHAQTRTYKGHPSVEDRKKAFKAKVKKSKAANLDDMFNDLT